MEPFWCVYGGFDLENIKDEIPYGSVVLWLCNFVIVLILVNLLIAMFADTYKRVKTEAEQEHNYQKAMRIFQYRHAMQAVPPPFNLLIVAVSSLVSLIAGSMHRIKSCVMTFCNACYLGLRCFFCCCCRKKQPPPASAASTPGKAKWAKLKGKLPTSASRTPGLKLDGESIKENLDKIKEQHELYHQVKPMMLVVEKVCADRFLEERDAEEASSLAGRLEAVQKELTLMSQRHDDLDTAIKETKQAVGAVGGANAEGKASPSIDRRGEGQRSQQLDQVLAALKGKAGQYEEVLAALKGKASQHEEVVSALKVLQQTLQKFAVKQDSLMRGGQGGGGGGGGPHGGGAAGWPGTQG